MLSLLMHISSTSSINYQSKYQSQDNVAISLRKASYILGMAEKAVHLGSLLLNVSWHCLIFSRSLELQF